MYDYKTQVKDYGKYSNDTELISIKNLHKDYLNVINSLNKYWKKNHSITLEQATEKHDNNWKYLMLVDFLQIECDEISKVYISPIISNYNLYVLKNHNIEPMDQYDFVTRFKELKEHFNKENE